VPREVCQRSTVSQSAIISQILSSLRPRIDAVVSQALSQNSRQVTQVTQVSSNRDALIRQQQLVAAKREQERRRLALLQQQQQQSVSSQSSSGSNLASIFGTGHEVTHSVDGQLKEQYNLGGGLTIGS
jgi:hypothetical protein